MSIFSALLAGTGQSSQRAANTRLQERLARVAFERQRQLQQEQFEAQSEAAQQNALLNFAISLGVDPRTLRRGGEDALTERAAEQRLFETERQGLQIEQAETGIEANKAQIEAARLNRDISQLQLDIAEETKPETIQAKKLELDKLQTELQAARESIATSRAQRERFEAETDILEERVDPALSFLRDVIQDNPGLLADAEIMQTALSGNPELIDRAPDLALRFAAAAQGTPQLDPSDQKAGVQTINEIYTTIIADELGLAPNANSTDFFFALPQDEQERAALQERVRGRLATMRPAISGLGPSATQFFDNLVNANTVQEDPIRDAFQGRVEAGGPTGVTDLYFQSKVQPLVDEHGPGAIPIIIDRMRQIQANPQEHFGDTIFVEVDFNEIIRQLQELSQTLPGQGFLDPIRQMLEEGIGQPQEEEEQPLQANRAPRPAPSLILNQP